MSCPNRNTRPRSGRMRPMAVFSMVVFPLPAAPSTILVCAGLTSNDTWSRAVTSSKMTLTSSNRSRTSCGAALGSAGMLLHVHKDARNEGGDKKYPDGSDHDGLRGGAAHSLRSARGSHPVKAADQRDHKGEYKRLDQSLRNVVIFERLVGRGPILRRLLVRREECDHEAPDQAHEVGDYGQTGQHDGRGDHTRLHQLLNRVRAQRAHSVDLLRDFHAAALAGDAGCAAACD